MKHMNKNNHSTNRTLIALAILVAAALLLIGQAAPTGVAKAASGYDYWDYTKATDQEISDAMYYMWYGVDGYSLDSCVFFLDRTMDHGGYCVWYSDGKQYRADFCLGTVTQGDRTDIAYIIDKDGMHQFTVEDFLDEDMVFVCNSTLGDLTHFRLSEDDMHADGALNAILRVKQFYELLG